ncbi:MAG: cadherin repeat domain-containing protein [Bacteroidia bacterium]|nr:cadherin repeat domain-containing protein [Bacteroidia bacterium]
MRQIHLLSILFLSLVFTQCSKDSSDPGTPDITVTASDFSTTIAENPTAGMVLGIIQGSTNSGSVTFSLTSESVAGAFSVNSSSGQLSVADATLFDFEINPTLTGTVRVANGSISKTANITVTLTDVDEMVAPTIWGGAKITFTKNANTDPNDMANQDRLTDKVILTRLNDGGQLINIVTETKADQPTSPAGTEWAAGTTANLSNLTFGTFRSLGKPKDVLVGNDFVLKLVEDNIVIDIKFLSWGQGNMNGGAFSYERSTSN